MIYVKFCKFYVKMKIIIMCACYRRQPTHENMTKNLFNVIFSDDCDDIFSDDCDFCDEWRKFTSVIHSDRHPHKV